MYFRTKERCSKPNCTEDVLIRSSHPVTSIALNPLVPYHLAAGSGDGCVRVYDRRMLGTRSENITLLHVVGVCNYLLVTVTLLGIWSSVTESNKLLTVSL